MRSLLLITGWLCVCMASANAEDPKTDKAARGSSAAPTAAEDTSEKEVLEFVQQHQPELAKLMNFLKNKKSGDYNQALKESRKVRDRLLTLKDRDPDLYKVELDLWKNAADIRLLAASVSAKSQKLDDEDRSRLKELIVRENELTIERLKLEKTRAEARLNQISQQLSRRQEQSDGVITKGLKTWENRIERSATKSKK